MTDDLLIYGAGGFAREVAWLVAECTATTGTPTVRAFIDDDVSKVDQMLNGLPIVSLATAAERWPGSGLLIAVGQPAARARMARVATERGFWLPPIVHPSVSRSEFIEMGAGTIICAGTSLTVNVCLGQHVHVNLNCTIGHDAVLEDFVTLAPGVHVSGWVTVERGAYVGTGAVIVNGTAEKPIVVGAGAIVGAGAVVTRDVPAGVTVVGVPAKVKAAARTMTARVGETR